jgi:hypothetical protein
MYVLCMHALIIDLVSPTTPRCASQAFTIGRQVKKRVTADRGELEEELKQLERQRAEEMAADSGAKGVMSPWEGLQAELRSMVSPPHAIYSSDLW